MGAKWGDFEVRLHYIGPMSMKNTKGVETALLYKYNLEIEHKDLEKMSWTLLFELDNIDKDKKIAEDIMTAVHKMMNMFTTPNPSSAASSLKTTLENISKKVEDKNGI